MSKIDPSQSAHPLKLLRAIIGVSQEKFAEVVGFSLATVSSAESGRRRAGGKLSPSQLEQIRYSIGALWDEGTRKWYFDPGGLAGRRMHYVREHFDTFRAELRREAGERAMLAYYMTLRFCRFCTEIPDKAFCAWYWRMEQQFERWNQEFNSDQGIELELEPLWDPELARTIGYKKIFPDLLHGEEQLFSQMIEAARKENQQTIERVFPRKPAVLFPKVTKAKKTAA